MTSNSTNPRSNVTLPGFRELFPEYIVQSRRPMPGDSRDTVVHSYTTAETRTTRASSENLTTTGAQPAIRPEEHPPRWRETANSTSVAVPHGMDDRALRHGSYASISPSRVGADIQVGLFREQERATHSDVPASQTAISLPNVPSTRVRQGYICDVCHRTFSKPSSFDTHMNSHTGARPYVCNHPGCTSAFTTASNLRRHERMHNPVTSSQPNASAGT